MADLDEKFNAMALLFAGLVFLELIFVVLFVPSAVIDRYNANERAAVAQDLGPETERYVVNTADALFRGVFVHTGMVAALDEFLFGGGSPMSGNPDYSGYQYVQDCTRSFWYILYAICYRLALIILWSPYLLPMFIAMLVDAAQERRVRQVRFSYVSPMARAIAARSRTSLLCALIVVLVLPVHVPAMAYPFVLGLLMVSAWATITHLQKHI